ncbi:MAG: glycosyltransferase family 2 protein [Chloroflexi bacterium]|nr:glycosyltransferase family 2 protein [Chloroflexota bacterium]
MDKTVSIIIPTYNERDNITPLVERIHRSLSSHNYEIVFVDDNSKDGTAELAKTLCSKYTVKVVVRKDKRGLASAVVDGLTHVSGEVVVVMDADLQHPPEALPNMLKALESYDFVVASRYCKGGSPGKWTLPRRLVSLVANLLALPLAPRVKDRMSGFFGFRRVAVDPALLNPLGWKIGLEIMVRSHVSSVTEVPYIFVARAHGSSKLSKRIIWQYLQQLVRLYFDKFRIMNFMVVGGIGYVINISLYSLLTLLPLLKAFEFSQVGKPYYLPPFVVSSLIAITSNYLMNRAWTFKGWVEHQRGFGRYMSMGIGTLLLDLGFLYLLVNYGKLAPVPAAALAILVVFIIRYVIARRWVWSEISTK